MKTLSRFAKAALDVSKSSGLLFPCSFTVYEEDNNVFIGHISTMKMTVELGLASCKDMRPVIEATAKAVNSIWERIKIPLFAVLITFMPNVHFVSEIGKKTVTLFF